MHADDIRDYEGPPCDLCKNLIGTCRHRKRRAPSPEMEKALDEAVARIKERQEREAKMTPEEYKKYIEEWAKRLADDVAHLAD